MGRRVRGLCLWQPPHVCLCGSAGLPGVEAWLWGDDCYSTGVGFKNAFLMGMHFTGKSSEVWEANITAAGAQEFSMWSCVGESAHQWKQPAICWRTAGRQQISPDLRFSDACSSETNVLRLAYVISADERVTHETLKWEDAKLNSTGHNHTQEHLF